VRWRSGEPAPLPYSNEWAQPPVLSCALRLRRGPPFVQAQHQERSLARELDQVRGHARARRRGCCHARAERRDCCHVRAPRRDCCHVRVPHQDCYHAQAPRPLRVERVEQVLQRHRGPSAAQVQPRV